MHRPNTSTHLLRIFKKGFVDERKICKRNRHDGVDKLPSENEVLIVI